MMSSVKKNPNLNQNWKLEVSEADEKWLRPRRPAAIQSQIDILEDVSPLAAKDPTVKPRIAELVAPWEKKLAKARFLADHLEANEQDYERHLASGNGPAAVVISVGMKSPSSKASMLAGEHTLQGTDSLAARTAKAEANIGYYTRLLSTFPLELGDSSPAVKDAKPLALIAFGRDVNAFADMSERLQHDKEIMFTALHRLDKLSNRGQGWMTTKLTGKLFPVLSTLGDLKSNASQTLSRDNWKDLELMQSKLHFDRENRLLNPERLQQPLLTTAEKFGREFRPENLWKTLSSASMLAQLGARPFSDPFSG